MEEDQTALKTLEVSHSVDGRGAEKSKSLNHNRSISTPIIVKDEVESHTAPASPESTRSESINSSRHTLGSRLSLHKKKSSGSVSRVSSKHALDLKSVLIQNDNFFGPTLNAGSNSSLKHERSLSIASIATSANDSIEDSGESEEESAYEEEEDKYLEEVDNAKFGTISRLKKTLKGEEYTIYVMAIRCFLHPFIGREERRHSGRWFEKVFGSNAASADSMSRAEFKQFRHGFVASTRNRLSSHKINDKIVVKTLRIFIDRLQSDWSELLSKGKGSLEDFSLMYKEVLRMEMMRLEGNIDKRLMGARMKSFDEIVKECKPESMVTRHASDQGPDGKKKVVFEGREFLLGKVFDISPQEHHEIVSREMRINEPQVIADELRRREAMLDNHAFYTSETFVHKTAAFIKWKKNEEESISKLMQTLGIEEEESEDEKEEQVESNGVEDLGGVLKITVVQARNLTGKDKSGTSDPYCIVECNGEKMRTSTVSTSLNPSWREVCDFEFSPPTPDSFTFKISIWDEDEVQEMVGDFLKKFRLHKDDFLGQLTLTEKRCDMTKFAIERWYKLEKRSKRSNISGDVFLKIQFVKKSAPVKTDDLLKTNESQVARRKSMDMFMQAPDYHSFFKTLTQKIVNYELSKMSAKKKKRGTVLRISPEFLHLFDEFGLRYGVGSLFRSLCVFEIISQKYVEHELGVFSLSYAFSEVNDVINQGGVRWTRVEQSTLAEVLDKLEKHLLRQISQYKDYFPFSTPPGHLQQTIKCLWMIYSNPVFRERFPYAKSVETVVKGCIKNSCTDLYTRCSAMSIPFAKESPQEEFSKKLKTLVEMILREIEADAIYFRKDFKYRGDTMSFYVDIVGESASSFGWLIGADIDGEMVSLFRNKYNPEVLSIYRTLKEYNDKNRSFVAQREDFTGFPLTEIFAPYIIDMLQQTHTRSLNWVKRAFSQDEFKKTSDTELHSSSVVDMFCLFYQTYDLIMGLDWDDEEQRQLFYEIEANTAYSCTEYYLRLSKEEAEKYVTEMLASRNKKDPFYLTDELCVRLNNLEVSKQQFFDLFNHIKYGRQSRLTLEQIVEDRKRSMNELSTQTVYPKYVTKFLKIIEFVNISRMSLGSLLLKNLSNVMNETFTHLSGGDSNAFTKLFKRSSKEDELDAGSIMRGLLNFVTVSFSSNVKSLYPETFQLLLQVAWTKCMDSVENCLIKKPCKGTVYYGLIMQGMDLFLTELDHLGFDRKKQEDLNSSLERYAILEEVIEILKTGNTDSLLSLYTFHKTDSSVHFLRELCLNHSDKRVKEYVKRN
eukprot:Nk52_evm6s301 gene=Nk52_evmTU6s301